jgi:sensor domain CHASE-containing protein
MSPAEALAAITFFASVAMVVLGVGHFTTKMARLKRMPESEDVEKRLARLEVAIDDMTAEIGRMSESHRFLTAALTQRGLPAEVSHGSK